MTTLRQHPHSLSKQDIFYTNRARDNHPFLLRVLVGLEPQNFSGSHPAHEILIPNGIQVVPASVLVIKSKSLIILLVLHLPEVDQDKLGDQSQVDH